MKTNAIIGRVKPVLSAMAAAVLLAACAAPEFKQPQIDTPTAFKEAQAPAVQTAADGTRWKQGVPAERQARGENVIASQFEEDRLADEQAAQDMLEGGAGQQEGDFGEH